MSDKVKFDVEINKKFSDNNIILINKIKLSRI